MTEVYIRRIKYMREAASVRRCHTFPHFGEYNVGYHTFNAVMMLLLIRPEAPAKLIRALLEHDMPERKTGDIPAPSKWFGVVDKKKLAEVEQEIIEWIFGEDSSVDLDPEDRAWLAGLDLLELFMWCKDQMVMGNGNAEVMAERIMGFVNRNRASLPAFLVNMFYDTAHHPWRMTPDFGDEE